MKIGFNFMNSEFIQWSAKQFDVADANNIP